MSTRQLNPPLGPDAFETLPYDCTLVQTRQELSEDEYKRVALLLESRPDVKFRIYSHGLRDLEFLRFFPKLKKLAIDCCYSLGSFDGLRYLSEDMEELVIDETHRPLDLACLSRFVQLDTLYVSGRHKNPEVIAELLNLRKLAIASTKLRELSILKPLKNLKILELRLGPALDLSTLPDIGKIRYLEIWMMKGLKDISPIGAMESLRYLFLQDLPQIAELPNMSKMKSLSRVHLEHLTGLESIAELAKATSLSEVLLVHMNQVTREMVRPLVGHPTLRFFSAGTGSLRRNEEVKELVGLPSPGLPDWDRILAD